mmetsp:Transcript_95503/g.273943  ORF Transcript_95503/g.273943 Transcript_95503/m.273943 type:complete len:262 (+) Transcript_95503:701-1486(+)
MPQRLTGAALHVGMFLRLLLGLLLCLLLLYLFVTLGNPMILLFLLVTHLSVLSCGDAVTLRGLCHGRIFVFLLESGQVRGAHPTHRYLLTGLRLLGRILKPIADVVVDGVGHGHVVAHRGKGHGGEAAHGCPTFWPIAGHELTVLQVHRLAEVRRAVADSERAVGATLPLMTSMRNFDVLVLDDLLRRGARQLHSPGAPLRVDLGGGLQGHPLGDVPLAELGGAADDDQRLPKSSLARQLEGNLGRHPVLLHGCPREGRVR